MEKQLKKSNSGSMSYWHMMSFNWHIVRVQMVRSLAPKSKFEAFALSTDKIFNRYNLLSKTRKIERQFENEHFF